MPLPPPQIRKRDPLDRPRRSRPATLAAFLPLGPPRFAGYPLDMKCKEFVYVPAALGLFVRTRCNREGARMVGRKALCRAHEALARRTPARAGSRSR